MNYFPIFRQNDQVESLTAMSRKLGSDQNRSSGEVPTDKQSGITAFPKSLRALSRNDISHVQMLGLKVGDGYRTKCPSSTPECSNWSTTVLNDDDNLFVKTSFFRADNIRITYAKRQTRQIALPTHSLSQQQSCPPGTTNEAGSS